MNIRTRALPATETQGERIRVTTPSGFADYPYDYGAGDAHQEAAERHTHKHCRRVGHSPRGYLYKTIECPFPNSPTHICAEDV